MGHATDNRLTARNAAPRRAFSLIEVVVVIALLVAISTLVMPACVGWIGEHRFRESLSSVETAIERWRSLAQRVGMVLVVTARERSGVLELIAASPDVGAAGSESAEGGVAQRIERFDSLFSDVGAEPEQAGSSISAKTASGTDAPGESLVCLLLPDGSAAGPRRIMLRDLAGRGARGDIQRWASEIRWTLRPPARDSARPVEVRQAGGDE